MKNKYNIALLPSTQSQAVIQYAQFLAPLADHYRLGENSLPHLTLCQFYMEDKRLPWLWEIVQSKLDLTAIELTFLSVSCKTFDNCTYWAALLPDKEDILLDMHNKVAELIKDPINKPYEPHMTLINTKDKRYESRVIDLEKRYQAIKDKFILSIGHCDEVGQFTKVLYQRSLTTPHNNTLL